MLDFWDMEVPPKVAIPRFVLKKFSMETCILLLLQASDPKFLNSAWGMAFAFRFLRFFTRKFMN